MERFLIVFLNVLLGVSTVFAQTPSTIIQQFLDQNHAKQQLEKSDITNWEISSQHTSSTSGLLHVYVQQTHQGLKIANGIANFAIKNHQVVSMGNRLVAGIQKKAPPINPKLSPTQAIELAAQQLGIATTTNLSILNTINQQRFIYNTGNISKKNIPVELMYYATSDNMLALVWDLSIYTLDGQHWWSIRIDAQTGQLLDKNDWIVHCNVDHGRSNSSKKINHQHTSFASQKNPETFLQPDQYTVFSLPIESPNHGSRSLVTNPSDLIASPYGWHDTDGISGPEYTITRGNNVYAYADSSNSSNPGFSPDGGLALEFNFPYTQASPPQTYQSAAITNLFYMNNVMHDVWYRYGFDEASGNFQTNNYNNGGLGGDPLIAEAQDLTGNNNARISIPSDGTSPIMELFLWNANVSDYLTINSPAIIARSYNSSGATFGSPLPSTPITADIVLAIDNTFPMNNACETLTNNTSMSGKIALIQGDNICSATTKVENAQNAGAIAAIIINSYSGPPVQLTGTNSNITIPVVQVSVEDGDSIKTQVSLGTVNGSIGAGSTVYYPEDSDLDNGIIAHEYAHGISTRLTGGSNLSNCLSNTRHIGEGLSDWFALIMTIEPGDTGADPRGFATYSARQPTTGRGIRPAAYSTDFTLNPYTYTTTNNLTDFPYPHGTGFIYGSTLWDLTWALIDKYGGIPDPDLYTGTGGNNIAMNLVLESLKLQPCNPSMIDGRDAILMADSILYNGIHKCLIWNIFAARGLGYNANAGNLSILTDQVEDFSVPCAIPTMPPIALFSHSSTASCVKTVSFIDHSSQIAQSWQWDFGDGSGSNQQNPIHNYDTAGTYIVSLISSNNLGSDTISQSVAITALSAPLAHDIEFCSGDSIIIPTTAATGTVQWLDTGNQLIYTGNTLVVTNETTPQTYYIKSTVEPISQYIGPSNRTFSNGSYIVSPPTSHRVLNFRADNKFEIVSAKVYANSTGSRTFYLSKGINSDGNIPSASQIVDNRQIIFTSTGAQRIELNFVVPDTGYYNIGGDSRNLYHETSGANYPYVLNGYMSIDSSSNPTNPTGYYYVLYNIEIRDLPCESPTDTVYAIPISSNFSYFANNETVTFTDVSLGATNWLWDFGDNNTSNQQHPTHTYASSGNYTVTLTINNGTCSSTQTFPIVVGVHTINQPFPSIQLLPNPATKTTSVLLKQTAVEDLMIELININGKVLQNSSLPAGNHQADLDLSSLASAIYFVRIKGTNFVETRKLVVE